MTSARASRPSLVSKPKVWKLGSRLTLDEQLLRQFDFQLVHPERAGWKETSNVIFSQRDMWIKITEAEK